MEDVRIEKSEIFDLLTRLVEKSLIQLDDSSGPRYSLLESIKEYACPETESGDLDPIRDRHFVYYLELAESHRRNRATDAELADVDNFRAALSWYNKVDQAGNRLRLLAFLWKFHETYGYTPSHLEELAHRPKQTDAADHSYLRGATWLALNRKDYEKAEEYATAHLAISRAQKDGQAEASCLNQLAIIHLNAGEFNRALTSFEDAAAVYLELGDRNGVAKVYYNIAQGSMATGDLDRAEQWLKKSSQYAEASKDDRLQGEITMSLGFIQVKRGNAEPALKHFERASGLLGEDDPLGVVIGLSNVAALRGDFILSTTLDAAHQERLRALGIPEQAQWANEETAQRLKRARTVLSKQQFDSAVTAGSAMTTRQAAEFGFQSLRQGSSTSGPSGKAE